MPATYDSIATQTITNTITSSVTFSSIPQTFTDLVLIGYCSILNSSSNLFITTNLNGITSGRCIFGYGTSTSRNVFRRGFTDVAESSNSQPIALEINLLGYSRTNIYKNYLSRWNTMSTSGSNRQTGIAAGIWETGTSAVTSITIQTAGGGSNFSNGSSFSLYGILKA